MMGILWSKICNEKGSVLNIALLILLITFLIGLYSSKSTTTDIRITSNEKSEKTAFYAAEGGWQVGVEWLDSQYPLVSDNRGLDNSGADITLTVAHPSDAEPLSNNSTYSVTTQFIDRTDAVDWGTDFKRVNYSVISIGTGPRNANVTTTVQSGKIEKVVGGY